MRRSFRHRRRRAAALIAVVVAAAAFLATIAQGALQGQLDPSFGRNGVVANRPPRGEIWEMLALPGGRILAGGDGIVLARYGRNGELDRAFGGSGYVPPDPDQSDVLLTGLARQANGRILVARSRFRDEGAVIRYRPNGRLDSSFGEDGATIAGDMSVDAMALQANGRIVVVGTRATPRAGSLFLRRFLPSGARDRSYGKRGHATVPPPFRRDAFPTSLAVQADGKLLVAAEALTPQHTSRVYLARLTRDGRLDRGFGRRGDGTVRALVGSGSYPSDVVVQRDGRILVSGIADYGDQKREFFVCRFSHDGLPDPSFGGGDGVATVRVRKWGYDGGIALRGRRIIQAGTIWFGNPHSGNAPAAFTVVQYRPDGRRYRRFGGDGVVFTHIGKRSDAKAIVGTGAGRVVVGGGARFGKRTSFALARYRLR